MDRKSLTGLADELLPLILRKLGSTVAGGGGGATPGAGVVPWANVDKTGSSLLHLQNRAHDLLTGLGDDDHPQYMHVSAARTVSAQHTFTGTQNFNAAIGIVSPDADNSFEFGRAWIGSVGHSDWAGFAHRAMASQGNYALIQHRSLGTILNGPPGTAIAHRINNVNAMAMDASTLAFYSVKSIRSDSFTSGFTGNGFRIDNGVLTPGKTTGEIDDLIVRGRMRVYELLVQQIRATNGSIFVSSTGKAKTVTGSGPYSIESEATHGFLPNDLIRAQRFTGNGVYQCNLQVTAVADTTHFTATLSSGDAPAVGMEFVRLGNTSDTARQNSIFMSADDTYNPYIDVLAGVNSFAAFGSPATRRMRIGNLEGLFGVPGEHGVFAGDGIGVTNKYLRIGSYTQESHNIPNKMYSGSNLFLQMDTSGLNFYVQSASTFADNTSVLFRRPDSTKILQLTGVNNFGGHEAALWLHPGTIDSTLNILSVAPSNFFARITLQTTVGGISSQWIFQRLSNGLVGAFFPGYLSVADSLGVGISSPTATLDVVRGGLSNGTAVFRGTTNSSHFNYSTAEDTYIRGGKSTSRVLVNDNAAGDILLALGGGRVGIATATPEATLHVGGGASIRVRNGSGGFVALNPGDASNVGYIEWYKANGSRIGYMGHGGSTNLLLALESAANLLMAGGQLWVGNSADIGFSAKIQTDGSMWAQGSVTAEGYVQMKAAGEPVAASGYIRFFMRSSDGKACIKKPDGSVVVLG